MSDYSSKKEAQSKIPPGEAYPELVKNLAEAKIVVDELHEKFTGPALAKSLGITKQSFQKFTNRARRDLGKEPK